jgi:SAM-dependent methyltransferase
MKLENSMKSITHIYKKLSTFGKILLFVSLLLILVVFFGKIQKYTGKEGFQQNETFVFKNGKDIYDDFYCTIYDHLVHNETKDNYELMSIIKDTSLTEKSVILDVGSGTGHHVGKLSQKNFNVRGIDISTSIIQQALKNYPEQKFIHGDVLDSQEFSLNTFTHILCLYFTIYFLENKRQFFDNCMDWLMPGGFLVVHLVDPHHFDPILPPGNPLYIVSPQKYAKKRITKTKINFNDFVYNSNFDYDETNEIGKFEEKFKFSDGKTRKQEQVLYMEDTEKIVAIAQQCGFILHAKIDMIKCAYEYQYLYVFMKPG